MLQKKCDVARDAARSLVKQSHELRDAVDVAIRNSRDCSEAWPAFGCLGVIASVMRWILGLGCVLALYYYIVAVDPDLLRWLLARLHW